MSYYGDYCPYCGKEVEINHDDGYGYDESRTFQQECEHCEKTFAYTTCISIDHELSKADCLNGEPHKMNPVKHSLQYWPNWVRCSDCGKEERGDYVEQ